MIEQADAPEFREWCICELMGHVKLAGLVTEVERFGGKVARLDIYEGDAEAPSATQFFGHSAIYRITPTTEKTARAFARGRVPEPVARWELPAIEAPRDREEDDSDGFEPEETENAGSDRYWTAGDGPRPY